MRKKIEIIFICAFILFNSAVIYARNANDYSEKNIEIMQNEIDTLKFRINELTREIALLKTALMKVSAPAPQQKKNNNAAAVENRNVKTAPQPARYGINTVISNENLPGAQRVQSGESGTRKNTGFDYNIIYQSRAEINQPIRYSMILPSGQNKNLMLVFEFSNNMMIAEEMFSGNISLVSEKKKDRRFVFRINQNTGTVKMAFIAGITGHLNSEALLFSDTNANGRPDAGEPSVLKNLTQNIMIEE